MGRLTNTRSPSLEEVLRAALDARLFDVHTCLPAKIVAYDETAQKVEVQPLLSRTVVDEEGGEEVEELPNIPDVPVVFPRGGGYFLTFPLEVGDLVTLVFHERSLDRYTQSDGALTDPGDLRMHDLSDPVAFPGFYPFSQALGSTDAEGTGGDLIVGKEAGKRIHINDSEINLGSKVAADFVALAGKSLTELERITDYLVLIEDLLTGTVINEPGNGSPSALQAALKILLDANPAPSPASVAASVVKAD